MAQTTVPPERVTPRALANHPGPRWRTAARWIREGELQRPRRVGAPRFHPPDDLANVFGAREHAGRTEEEAVR